jgi:hypothetical protein
MGASGFFLNLYIEYSYKHIRYSKPVTVFQTPTDFFDSRTRGHKTGHGYRVFGENDEIFHFVPMKRILSSCTPGESSE